jgi:amphi-Trp domain-containing protein
MTQQDEDKIGWHMQGSAEEIADILVEFARELRKGDVNIWKGQRELHLNPEGKLSLYVEAKANDDREWLDIQLGWSSHLGGDPFGA